MNIRTTGILVVSAIVVIGAGIAFAAHKNNTDTQANATPTPVAEVTPASNPLVASIETNYTTETAAYSVAPVSGMSVLFFTASDCTACQTDQDSINTNAAEVPAGAKIVRVDYDTQAALAAKLGVTAPDTFVQVASDGAVTRKWVGGGVSELTSQLLGTN